MDSEYSLNSAGSQPAGAQNQNTCQENLRLIVNILVARPAFGFAADAVDVDVAATLLTAELKVGVVCYQSLANQHSYFGLTNEVEIVIYLCNSCYQKHLNYDDVGYEFVAPGFEMANNDLGGEVEVVVFP